MYKITRFYKTGFSFAFFSEFIAIYPLYNLMFKDFGMSPMYIATLLIIQKASKMVFDIPSGLMADFYGRRGVLILGTILKAGMLFLFWIKPSFLCFAIGMAMWGMSMSCFFGHVGAYAYDFLRIKKEEKKFAMFMGFYYVMENISGMIACMVGGNLYENGHLDMALLLSLFMMLVTLFFGLQLPKYASRQLERIFENDSRPINFRSYWECISNAKTLFFVVFLAFSTAIFLFFFDLNTILMNDSDYGIRTVSKIVGLVAGMRIIGNIIAAYIAPKVPIMVTLIITSILLFIINTGFTFSNAISISAISAYLVFFAIVDIVINTKMQPFVVTKLRATVMSISNLFGSFILIGLHFINGYIAENESYMDAIFVTMNILFCITMLMMIWYYYIFIKKSDNAGSS